MQFKSEKQALQYLSDYTGKKIKIATEEWYKLPLADDLMDKIEAIYELEYKYHTLKNNVVKWTGLPKRYDSVINKMENLIKDIASEIADDLIDVFEDWLSRHALTDADKWAKARMNNLEEGFNDNYYLMESIEDEYDQYVGGDFNKDLVKVIDKHIDDFKDLKEYLIDFGRQEKESIMESKQEEDDYDEDEVEKELEYLDDPEEVWQYLIDSFGIEEVLSSFLPDYIKEDFGFVIYKDLIFPAWFEKWSAEGIEETRDRVEETNNILHNISSGSVDKIGDITVGINRALNEAHQTGEMLEYISEKHDITKSALDTLSNRDTSDWNKELTDIGLKVAGIKNNTKEISRKTLASGKFLELQEIEWQDDNGSIHKWESVERTNNGSAVLAIAYTNPSRKLVLIRQYRPPIGTYEIGFPAGMIDDGEDPKESIIRELKEETGYTGFVKNITPLSVNTAGLSSESCYIAEMEIDENLIDNTDVKQNLEEDEEIEVFLVDENELPLFINKFLKMGDRVSGKFMSYLIGKGFDFSKIEELEMIEEKGSVFYDSEEEALQHLADLTGKSIKIPNKSEPTVANEDVDEDEDKDSMTSSDIGDSLRNQGEEVTKKFDEAASAIDEAIGSVSSAVEGSGSF